MSKASNSSKPEAPASESQRDSISPESERAPVSRVEAALNALRQGQQVILVDEQEHHVGGVLLLSADQTTPEHINFMASYGRGLVCLALTSEQVSQLELNMMQRARPDGEPTSAFTVSIEAAHGVTTGISASDRARTVLAAINSQAEPSDVVTPGHIFPLRGRPGGVLVRSGKTEAALDLTRLAGRVQAGVLCDILGEDGGLANLQELKILAETHGLCLVSIADIIRYRLQTEYLIRRVEEQDIHLDLTRSGWRAIVYEASVDGRELLALVKGDLTTQRGPVLCRMHAGSVLGDMFMSTQNEGGKNLKEALLAIEQAGVGVLVYLPSRGRLRQELSGLGRVASADPAPAAQQPTQGALREYGLGAQVLRDLGVRKVNLLTNSDRKIAGIRAYGLDIVERVPLVSMAE